MSHRAPRTRTLARHLLTLALPALAATGCNALPTLAGRGVAYRTEHRKRPRPLVIHIMRIDLRRRGDDLCVAVAPDPDGDGPAESVLMPPRELAAGKQMLAAVNTNPWAMMPNQPTTLPGRKYVAGHACNIHGWALADGRTRSPVERHSWSFWITRAGNPGLGPLTAPPAGARLAVGGFGGLLRRGRILPRPSENRHPRTALGLDRDRRHLTLVVVDGRWPGYSEGMSTHELAALMLDLGCHDALNLDGGGSSVMLQRDSPDQPLQVKNRPAVVLGPLRPLPVVLGVRGPD